MRRIIGALLVSSALGLLGCGGELVGGAEQQGSGVVEVFTAEDLARGIFNTGLVAEDEVGETVGEPATESEMAGYIDPGEGAEDALPKSQGTAVNEAGEWIAETASGKASLASVRSLSVEPSANVVPGDVAFATVTVENKGQLLEGVAVEVEVTAPTGARSLLVQSFDLPAEAMAFVHLETPALPAEGSYRFRSSLRDAEGEVLAQGPELELKVAAERAPMATTFSSIMRTAATFRYARGTCSNRYCLASTHRGDCWAMSDWLWYNMERIRVNARIIQYRTAYSSRHRTVQYVSSGRWRDLPYSSYGISTMFRPTTSKPGMFVYRN